MQKTHVELEHVNRHVLQRVQRGISFPEIVHLHKESVRAQRANDRYKSLGVFHIGCFRDLKPQFARFDAVFLRQIDKCARKVWHVDIRAGNIDGDGNGGQPLCVPARE
ncbi:hypothetical protein SDC9_93478 [bioreactor metagenome]|uniref:Uncharacterized protein n=1 Tax=bioreactor metagenome TaxID=1076179 RepID=A0A645A155_9ZZZZ